MRNIRSPRGKSCSRDYVGIVIPFTLFLVNPGLICIEISRTKDAQ